MKKNTGTTSLEKALASANGRRRMRLLSVQDIVDAAVDLRPGEHRFLHGGHVAGAYDWPASATGAVVYIPAGRRAARAIVKVVDARPGCTGFGREKYWSAPDTETRLAAETLDGLYDAGLQLDVKISPQDRASGDG
tara:strand:- start:1007 stop:1414 length:408 start_codon:yes stop_codon:yes gene_type:complete